MASTEYQRVVAQFLDELEHNAGRSPRTCEIYDLALKRLAEFAASVGRASALDVTGDELTTFTGRWLYDRGVSARARGPYIGAIRTFFRWCAKSGVAKDVARNVEYPKMPKADPVRMTLSHAEALLHKPDLSTLIGLRDSAMLHLLIGCGIRVSALTGINDGDLVADVIQGEPRLLVKVRTKGAKERMHLLPREADLAVRMYLESPELAAIDRIILEGPHKGDKVLFVSFGNRSLTPDLYVGERRRMARDAVNDMIARYGKRAGIPADQLHPHALRHLFGTELVESNVNLAVVQSLMDHSDPKSTLVYVHLAAVKNAKELDRGNPLAKMSTPFSQFLAQMKSGKA